MSRKNKAFMLNQKIDKEFNAAGKAMSDVFAVFEANNIRIMPGVPKTAPKYMKIFDFPILMFYVFFVLKKDDFIFYSFPENIHKIKFLNKFAAKRGIKLICFINDINSIRDGHFDDPDTKAAIDFDMKLIGGAYAIMAPNNHTKEFFKQRGITSKIISVGTWDYIMKDDSPIGCQKHCEGEKWKIAFAGNLNKAGFISKLDDVFCDSITYKLWGNSDKEINSNLFVEYMGSVSPMELPYYVSTCNFGLVWDGTGVHECSGGTGEYLKYNNSHKCGLYLASGLPVFVWSNAGLADFVKENKCGFVIDNLDDIERILTSMTNEEYDKLLEYVLDVSAKIRRGYYLDKATKKILAL